MPTSSRQGTQYVIHPRLEGLLRAVAEGCVQCHLDMCRTPRRLGSVVVGDDIDLVIVAVVGDATAHEGTILHAARVPVERVPTQVGTMREREQLRQDSSARIDAILSHLQERLTGMGLSVAPGLRLMPGMSDDMERNLASQQMWRIHEDGKNPLTRRIDWLVETH